MYIKSHGYAMINNTCSYGALPIHCSNTFAEGYIA